MDIFEDLGVNFETRDVLSDPEIRDGIKQFTNWPTIPQIFINGEFVGGCDIVRDLYASGELAQHVVEIMESFEKSSAAGRHIDLKTTCARPAAVPAGLAANELDT